MQFWPKFSSMDNVTLLICLPVVPQEKKTLFFSCSDRHASKKAEVGDFMPVQW